MPKLKTEKNKIPNFIKNFVEWFKLKPNLDKRNHEPPLVSERQIWWCILGENIGTEVSGKNGKFTRPVIIYKKLSRYTFFVIPMSSQIKEGTWYVPFDYNSKKSVACLHQVKVVDYRRLDDKMGTLDKKDFANIAKSFHSLYKPKPKNMPPKDGGRS